MFRVLSEYKHVDSAGPHLQNTEELAPLEGYVDWISQYKFMICFENSFSKGYITEKSNRPYQAKVVPIYSSHISALEWLNKDSMVFHVFGTEHKVTADKVIELDKDDELYCKMVNADPFTEAGKKLFDWDRVEGELDKIGKSFG